MLVTARYKSGRWLPSQADEECGAGLPPALRLFGCLTLHVMSAAGTKRPWLALGLASVVNPKPDLAGWSKVGCLAASPDAVRASDSQVSEEAANSQNSSANLSPLACRDSPGCV